jgi:hypothetical protein
MVQGFLAIVVQSLKWDTLGIFFLYKILKTRNVKTIVFDMTHHYNRMYPAMTAFTDQYSLLNIYF